MAATTPLGEGCIENRARALHSEAVRCMLAAGPETKMEIPGKGFSSYILTKCKKPSALCSVVIPFWGP